MARAARRRPAGARLASGGSLVAWRTGHEPLAHARPPPPRRPQVAVSACLLTGSGRAAERKHSAHVLARPGQRGGGLGCRGCGAYGWEWRFGVAPSQAWRGLHRRLVRGPAAALRPLAGPAPAAAPCPVRAYPFTSMRTSGRFEAACLQSGQRPPSFVRQRLAAGGIAGALMAGGGLRRPRGRRAGSGERGWRRAALLAAPTTKSARARLLPAASAPRRRGLTEGSSDHVTRAHTFACGWPGPRRLRPPGPPRLLPAPAATRPGFLPGRGQAQPRTARDLQVTSDGYLATLTSPGDLRFPRHLGPPPTSDSAGHPRQT